MLYQIGPTMPLHMSMMSISHLQQLRIRPWPALLQIPCTMHIGSRDALSLQLTGAIRNWNMAIGKYCPSQAPRITFVQGGLYCGGSARIVEKALGVEGDDVLYVG